MKLTNRQRNQIFENLARYVEILKLGLPSDPLDRKDEKPIRRIRSLFYLVQVLLTFFSC